MGYDFHVTRAESWPESEATPIAREEWESLADASDSLKRQGSVNWADLGVQPVYGIDGSSASFSWRHGRVVISGHMEDDAWALAQLIATDLGARLVGDDE